MLKSLSFLGLLLCLLFCGSTLAHKESPLKPGDTYLIVHGAWGGAWDWRIVDKLLTEKGHYVHRATLTGLGEREHLASVDIGLEIHIQDVVNILRFDELDNVILVGHSYGGMIISAVADRMPERVKHLIFIDALLPEDGESVSTLPGTVFGEEGLRKMSANGFMIPGWLDPKRAPPADRPHPLKSFLDPISLKNKQARKLPATYVWTVEKGTKPSDDTFAPHAERAKQRTYKVYTMEGDHNPQNNQPENLVPYLLLN